MNTHSRTLAPWSLVLAAVCTLFATTVSAAEDPPGSHRDWGVSWKIRAGGAGGGYGDFLHKGTAWDLDIFKQRGDWRYGVGLMFGSLSYSSPYDASGQPEWAHFETFAYAQRMFRDNETLRPYLQGRVGIARVHPRSTHDPEDSWFLKEPADELDPGESATDAVNGIGLSFIPGVEFDLTNSIALDLSAYVNFFLTDKYALQDYLGNRPVDHEDTGTGVEWGTRVGVTWRPLSFDRPVPMRTASPDTTPLDPPSKFKDAWDVTVSPGWAAAEVLAINFGASMFNEYVRQANFNQISPRSFWANIEDGFEYDDNKFKTNQLIHPFNGSTYYNGARANGLSYWPSTIFALTGAFIWEAMGETHPMSYNDMISTGIGGIAFGEATYRISSSILDNRGTGSGRVWREIGAFLVDPVRGFNRFLSGQATRVSGNPESPYDWRPLYYNDGFSAGVRTIGKGESIHDSTQTQAYVQINLNHGSPWDNSRRKPFDHFDFAAQFNGDDKVPLGRLQIRGDLFSKSLGERKNHAIAFVQYFDYVNNNAYEFGGQSFGGAFYSRFRTESKLRIQTRLDLALMLLGGVNSDYAYVVVTPEQERPREYDYGDGGGASLEVQASYNQRVFVNMFYRGQMIHVTNGSIYNGDSGVNYKAEHFVEATGIGVQVPLRSVMSVGVDGIVFLRQSHFDNPEFIDRDLRVPQVRMYLAWSPSRGTTGPSQ